MYNGFVEVSVWILVVLMLVYVYWLCGDKFRPFGCMEVSVWILVVLR